MPAVVTKILVAEGETVEKGQGVVVVSAMKMDTTLAAPIDGVVARINVAEGDKVTPKQVLVDITPVPVTEPAEP
jgi:biotin carboxyl carrier protein